MVLYIYSVSGCYGYIHVLQCEWFLWCYTLSGWYDLYYNEWLLWFYIYSVSGCYGLCIQYD